MESAVLEQILESAPKTGQTGMYETIDNYVSGTTILYTPMPKPFFGPRGGFEPSGISPIHEPLRPIHEPVRETRGFDLPESGAQFHFHEIDGRITGGSIKSYNGERLISLDNYQIAMGDYYAKQLGLKPIDFKR